MRLILHFFYQPVNKMSEEIEMVKKVLDTAQSLPEGPIRKAIVGQLRELIAQLIAKAAVLVWFDENKQYAPTKEEIENEKKDA